MRAEEFQLLLLLPSQRVGDGDGEPQGFPGVPVRPQGVHAGAGRGDVLCKDTSGRSGLCALVHRQASLGRFGLTVPQRPPSCIQVVVVTVVGVVVRAEDVLQVGVLPVKVAGLDSSSEHGSVWSHQRVCGTEGLKDHRSFQRKSISKLKDSDWSLAEYSIGWMSCS